MKKKRHYPPSRLRYEQANPTISVRVSRQLHERLKSLKEKSGKSVGDVVREALGVQEKSLKGIYRRGYNKGWTDAEQRYRVDYPCSRCGGTLTIDSDEEKQAAAMYMREQEWCHGRCIR
ncbi:MAG: ribbon-helix-helix protein, CopG family [Chloroflexi bacterium]|nr:ribbon-helix-helix protein, CopG family [Chloroflexota bacterium]